MSQAVHQMFSNIARRYDLANDVLSFGIHRLWRKTLCSTAGNLEGRNVVDLCSGTGDVAFELARRVGRSGRVFGVDFVHGMLEIAHGKQAKKSENRSVDFIQGDALALPLPDKSCHLATVAFGIRNVDNPLHCLREMKRVLAEDGKAAVLEFGQPVVPGFAFLYRFYSAHILPFIGGVLTGNRNAYQYLERTSREFPAGDKFLALMRSAGFAQVHARPLFGGVAYIYTGHAS